MKNTLLIRLLRAEGALTRLLGVADRRGYPPVLVSASPLNAHSFLVHLTVHGEKPIEKLVHQFEKLYDVESVEYPS